MSHHLPVGDSTKVFNGDLFKGKVLFCTGGEFPRGWHNALADGKAEVEYVTKSPRR